MHRLPVVLISGLVLVACEVIDEQVTGETGDGGSVATPDEIPRYNRGACGSLPASGAPVSNTRAGATAFGPNQLVGGRIDPESMTNKEHFWSIQLAKGSYHLVLDSSRADGGESNVGLRVVRLDAQGADQDQVTSGNEIARYYRDAAFFKVTTDQVVQFKVTGNFEMEDYSLGVFPNDASVPSPRFHSCPTIDVLNLAEALSFVLGPSGEANEEKWFLLNLGLGDYDFFAESVQADGVQTNLIYYMHLLDQFGQESRAAPVFVVNEIETSFGAKGTSNVGEQTSYWVRFRNGNEQLNMTLTVSPQ